MLKHFFSLLLIAVTLQSCLEPTTPEFRINEAFYLAEGNILAGEEGSEIRISASQFSMAQLRFTGIADAEVISREEDGRSVSWLITDPEKGAYSPPTGFSAAPGESWFFEIALADGTRIVSEPETVPEVVPVNDINLIFEQNSIFDEGRNRFIPRFEIFIDYQDPAGEKNYYAYDFRYWEEVIICISCPLGFYNRIECVPDPSVNPRYDYYCDTDECYSITEGLATVYSADEFYDGNAVENILIGGVTFDNIGGLLVEAELRSISEAAYDYGKVIQDLITGSSGLNPTIPAALNGNVRNADPDGRTVLGYLGAAAPSRLRRYILRTYETGAPLAFDNNIFPPPIPPPGVPPRAPCNIPGRTSERPEGWQQ